MKKLVSLTLALVLMAFTVSGITAFAAQAPSVSSDTAKTLSIEQGKNYTFKFMVSGTSSLSVTVGNPSVLSSSVKKAGNAYLVTIAGVNQGSTGVYTTFPGQKGVCQCIVTVQQEKITFGYQGCDYGCVGEAQLNYVKEKALAVTSTEGYKKNYEYNKQISNQEFQDFYGVPYSDEANMISSVIGYIGNDLPRGGDGKGSTGSAYDCFMGTHSVCADIAKAIQATLHANGVDCKLCVGINARKQPHMWTTFKLNNNEWYQWGNNFSKGVPKGYTLSSISYNYY
ncbi:transglutaminase domain-containing protein [Caproiciproducens galactitolivorans]|uniref:transglutaminase domain-containing protein n=1 Tax=Caproiciproducens galactitolivorans TaxID=642589 RepID=UPI002409EE8E|nr:transglutaminase domain-containing protein [Caproiciproducens galactitolivorans]